MFLSYIHSFRAITILIIVAGHVVAFFDWTAYPSTFFVVNKLLQNGSVLFVFVGGFLFEHLSADYNFPEHIRRKFMTVVLPYLLISIPAIVYSGFLRLNAEAYPFLMDYSWVERAVWFYWSGGAHLDLPLWFIPMISIIYLAAPLLILFVRHPRLYWLLLILIPFSALAHRPDTLSFYPTHNLEMAAYFAPVYVLGMWASANRSVIESFLRRHFFWVAGVFVLYVIGEALFEPYPGNYHGRHLFSQERGLIDWLLIQKLILCFLLMGITLRWEKLLAAPLKFIGTASFTIYLLHFYFIVLFNHAIGWVKPPVNVLTIIGVIAVSTALCCLVAWLAQRLFGSRSRSIVGT